MTAPFQIDTSTSKLSDDNKKKKLSPVAAMAEASVLSQKAAVKEDPTDQFTARKHKLDEACVALGEDLYSLKMNQLRNEFLNSTAM